jgi:hypothetical protein
MTRTRRPGRRLLGTAVALAAAGVLLFGLASLVVWAGDLTAGSPAVYSTAPTTDWSTVRLLAGNVLTITAGGLLAAALVVGVVGGVTALRRRGTTSDGSRA